jgi:hypothetical protein
LTTYYFIFDWILIEIEIYIYIYIWWRSSAYIILPHQCHHYITTFFDYPVTIFLTEYFWFTYYCCCWYSWLYLDYTLFLVEEFWKKRCPRFFVGNFNACTRFHSKLEQCMMMMMMIWCWWRYHFDYPRRVNCCLISLSKAGRSDEAAFK